MNKTENMNAELIAKLIKATDAVFNGTPVILAYVYGSRVNSRPRADSDLDVGYYVRPTETPPAMKTEMQMADRLSNLLGIEVDLRNLNNAPLALRGRILEQGRRIFCSDQVARVNIERELLGMYHDYKAEFAIFHIQRLRSLAASKHP